MSVAGVRVSRDGSHKKKCIWYNLYGWGCSTLIVTISVIMNYLPKSVLPWYVITPQYGIGQCWMPRKYFKIQINLHEKFLDVIAVGLLEIP